MTRQRPILTPLLLSTLVLVLPLMMGNRTPWSLTATALVLVVGAGLALVASGWLWGSERGVDGPPRGWWVFAGVLTALVVVQVWPSVWLARVFGPYPEALWRVPGFEPVTWSPNPAATLRGWAVFVALFIIAWMSGTIGRRRRAWLWLAVAAMAVFQGLYGLISHAWGSETIFGIWERHGTDFVHGSFSNRNLFAGYLALTWPMAIAVWWLRDVPGLSRLPTELRITGSIICGAIIGAALLASASRLGSTAGLAGLFVALLLWTRYRGVLSGGGVWAAWLTALGAFLFATWYGLAPLTERLSISSIEESRFQVFELMFREFPGQWWLTGVGLGGFEAVFKQIQEGRMGGWWDYAHNDVLQWLLETGLVGAVLLASVLVALWRQRRIRLERVPLYAGLVALALVGLGDFSWHIPGTQVVIALYLGVLLRTGKDRRQSNPVVNA